MAGPWKCPDCGTWLAPHVSFHRCQDDGGAAVNSPRTVAPGGGGGGGTTTIATPPTIIYSNTGTVTKLHATG